MSAQHMFIYMAEVRWKWGPAQRQTKRKRVEIFIYIEIFRKTALLIKNRPTFLFQMSK